MEIVKLLLLTLLPAVVLGCLVGIFAGKHKVKKEAGQIRSILNTRQRILYSVSILVGISCILFGILYTPEQDMGDMGMDSGFYDDSGMMEPGMEEPADEVGLFENPNAEMMAVEEDALPDEPLDFEEDQTDSEGEPADQAAQEDEVPQPETETQAADSGVAVARPARQATASVNRATVWAG